MSAEYPTSSKLTVEDQAALERMKAEYVTILWNEMRQSAASDQSPALFYSDLRKAIIDNSRTMAEGLSRVLSHQQADGHIESDKLRAAFLDVYSKAPSLVYDAAVDLKAIIERDPAAVSALNPFLFFKGFHAIQIHRVAHYLWRGGHRGDALFLQNRSSVLYGVDIHPAARIGVGVMVDHATGLVIGETAVVEDNVSMLHDVTLGGTGKERGDRHPKIRQGVMIGAGAKILGYVEVGMGACIAAGSVVLKDVPAHTTVAGVPAIVVGMPRSDAPAREMDQKVVD